MLPKDIEEWLRYELMSINMALPKRPLRLSMLLHLEEPFVETVGGGRHYFDKKELEELRKLLPSGHDVLLPIVFVRRGELGEGVYLIKGGKDEAEAFRLALGLSDVPYSPEGYYTYKPFILEFLRKFKTLGIIGTL